MCLLCFLKTTCSISMNKIFGRDLQVRCLAEHPQAKVVFNEVLSAGEKDGFKQDVGKQRGAWLVQEAYLVRIIYLTLFYCWAACNYVSRDT